MIRTTTALLFAATMSVLAVSDATAKTYCRSCGEEIPQVIDLGGWFGALPPTEANKALPRRRAHFYAWQGGCYALDRSRQWRWVDPAFC